MGSNVDVTDSIDAVHFDAEDELYHATYDSARDSTSVAVVSVVASALGKDLCALSPLQSALDTDALDSLIAGLSPGSRCEQRISFSYEGFEVTVTGEGTIEADPTGDAQFVG